MVKAIRSFTSWPACFELLSRPLKRLAERKHAKVGTSNSRKTQIEGARDQHPVEESSPSLSIQINSENEEISSILSQVQISTHANILVIFEYKAAYS